MSASVQKDLFGNIATVEETKEFRIYVNEYTRDQCKKLTVGTCLNMLETAEAIAVIGTLFVNKLSPDDWKRILEARKKKDLAEVENILSSYLK